MPEEAFTIERALAFAERLDSQTASVDVEALLCHTLDKTRTFLLLNPQYELSEEARDQFLALFYHRERGVPIAHLVGYRGFWTLDLEVNDSTLIPRPDTECLVEAVLESFQNQNLKVLDLGTGTGAIALALAVERATWRVTATDFSASAIDLARRNAQSNRINNVVFRQGSWFGALESDQQFDLIVSNPPYIDENDHHLSMGDLRFEPSSALVAKESGLADIRHIVSNAPNYLVGNGALFVEHGYDQREAVQNIFVEAGFQQVRTYKDYGGNERFTAGRRASDE